jgi:eukaryotic-like serine/threonine-protein kinase
MTIRDPRSRDFPLPAAPAGDGGREATQSIELGPEELAPSSPELAFGTHNRQGTRIESPGGRARTAPPPSPHSDDPDGYRGAVLGSYRVLELLGKGGMGYVYRAEHVKLGREVALKLLRRDYACRRDAVARFFQEARTVNRVRHRNIVDVTDFVELDDGTTYIIMELLTGTSLGAWARTGIDLPRALAVLVQICDGLGAAHQVGVVHRDLKPDNVIVVPTSDGAELVKLLDFGVAKLLNRDDEDVGFETAAGSVIGTPAYMSPEQAGGMVVDARSDIYSLGAIMYELFCSEPMFRGRSFGEYVRKHLTELPIAPRDTPGGAALDPALEAVILRCLEKDPELRFGHILELRDVLFELLGHMATLPPVLARPSAPGRAQATRLPSGPALHGLPSARQSFNSAISAASVGPARHPGSSGHALPSHPARAAASAGFAGSPAAQLATGRVTPGTPWWVWAIGGAAAVVIGVGAAVWYAGRADRGEPPPSPVIAAATPTPATTAQPIEPAPARSRLVEIRFDSRPAGGVFADGQTTELCRTPCTLNIDLADGGPADRRSFVVQRAGYSPGLVTVDLTSRTREFRVELQPVPARPSPEVAPARRVEPTRPDRRPARRPGKPRRDPKDPPAAVPHDPAPDHASDPSAGVPAPSPKPPSPTIDPADTLDPFRAKP